MIYDNTSTKSLCGYSIKAIEEINGIEHAKESDADDNRAKRQLIAIALMALGFILCLGTVGDMEFHNIWSGRHTVRCVIGLLLMAAAVPVSGDVSANDVERLPPRRKR